MAYDAPGTYLVFLARDGGVLATENNEWGRLRIGGGKVATSKALAEIRALLGPPLWIATGALALGLGFVVASRSRRR